MRFLTDQFVDFILKVLQLRFQVAHLALIFPALVQVLEILLFWLLQIHIRTCLYQLLS